jgi:endoglucanase
MKKSKIKKISSLHLGLSVFTVFLVAGVVLLGIGSNVSHDSTRATAYAQSNPATTSSSDTTLTNAAMNSEKSTNTPTTAPNPAANTTKTVASSTSLSQSTTASTVTAAPSVNASLKLYANTGSNVAVNAESFAAENPSSASVMNRLASTPMAQWFGDFSGNITNAVNNYVSAAANAQQLPVLVAYNIPDRDCGSYSSGGATSSSAYETWISQFAAAIGSRSAVVILEPDALAGMDCLSSSNQQIREQLLSYAVQTLHAYPNISIYIDAGNSGWQTVSVMASRLNAVDIAQATGFSLNVSNFYTTSSNTAYGESLSSLIGGKHFVIDTSRNGNGPDSDDDWCNPDGRAFGQTPTLQTGNNLIDAYLWVKSPGESDGQCGPSQDGTSAPAAGGWWAEYALMLATNSAGW